MVKALCWPGREFIEFVPSNSRSGHSGGRPLNKQIEGRTNVLSFFFLELGVSSN